MKKRQIVGLLLVIGFIVVFIEAMIWLLFASFDVGGDSGRQSVRGLIDLGLGALMVVGAFFALTGKSRIMAFIGSMVGCASIAYLVVPLFFVAVTALGVISLVLLLQANEEFGQNGSKEEDHTGYYHGGTIPGALPPR